MEEDTKITMNITQTTSLIYNAFGSFGAYCFIILGTFLTLCISYLIFKTGFNQLKNIFTDKSLKIGGYYLRNLPYKGYNRFRSEKWNMDHM